MFKTKTINDKTNCCLKNIMTSKVTVRGLLKPIITARLFKMFTRLRLIEDQLATNVQYGEGRIIFNFFIFLARFAMTVFIYLKKKFKLCLGRGGLCNALYQATVKCSNQSKLEEKLEEGMTVTAFKIDLKTK